MMSRRVNTQKRGGGGVFLIHKTLDLVRYNFGTNDFMLA